MSKKSARERTRGPIELELLHRHHETTKEHDKLLDILQDDALHYRGDIGVAIGLVQVREDIFWAASCIARLLENDSVPGIDPVEPPSED